MHLVILPFIVIVIVAAFFFAGDIVRGVDFSLPDFELSSLSMGGQPRSTAKTAEKQPSLQATPQSQDFVLDTIITEGPSEGAVYSDATTVTFAFMGSVFPNNTSGTITFETKLEGVDNDWLAAKGKSRKLSLPSDSREYRFFVRSKLGTIVDTSPVVRTFRINTSPSFGKVHISKVKSPTSTRSSLTTLTTSLTEGETVNITGWKIEARTDTYTIPTGVKQFASLDTSRMLKQGILLQRGTKVFISTAFNPVANNINYKPNLCLGDLEHDRNFPIGVPGSCNKVPKPSLSEISYLSPSCQNYIRNNTGKCEFPDFEKQSTVTSNFDCFAYMQNLEDRFEEIDTYEYCYQQHFQESGFIKNEWHIYTEGEEFLRPSRDRLILYDQNNLFVDDYVY